MAVPCPYNKTSKTVRTNRSHRCDHARDRGHPCPHWRDPT